MKGTFKLLLFILIILSGCSIYTPQTIDIPLISEKKELRADAGISFKELFYCTLSYGLTDNIALQTYFNRSFDSRFFMQNAFGIYRNSGINRVLELYSGFGFGRTETGNHDIPTKLKGNYQLYFLQLNMGKIRCRFANADLGFGIKAGYLHSDLDDLNYFTRYQPYYGTYEVLTANNLLLEPAAFIRIGGEKLKFSLKLGSCLHYQLTMRDKQLPFDFWNLGLGVNYRF
jgi:hypothetical protein